jgi:hypothetical protein
MKKTYTVKKKIIFLSFILLFTSIALSEPEWITFPGGSGTPGEKPIITMLDNSSEHIVYSVDIPGMWREQVVKNNITFDDIHLPEYGYSYDIGWPQVPNIQELFATPTGANENVEVNILGYNNVVLDDYYLYPVQHPISINDLGGPEQEFDYDEEFYSHDVWYPPEERCAEGVAPGTFRDFDVITSVLYPMKFNPYQSELDVRYHIVVEIRYIVTLGGDYWSKYRPSKDFQKMYPYIIENLKDGPWLWDFDEKKDVGKTDLLPNYIIFYDDITFGNNPDFFFWLNILTTYLGERQYNTEVFTTSQFNGDPYLLWNFLRGFWDQYEGNIEYVLLIGDVPQPGDPGGIPMPYWTKFGDEEAPGPSDVGYARLTAENNDPLQADIYPEVIVGRMVVNDVPEFANIVYKTTNYYYSDTPEVELWEGRALLVASRDDPEFDNTKRDIAIHDYTNPPINDFEPCYGIEGKTNMNLINYINSGYSIINYYGHGGFEPFNYYNSWLNWSAILGEDWTGVNIYALNNVNHLPVVFQLACQVGMLDYYDYDSLCEYWLNAGVNNINKIGAVSCCGATRDVVWFKGKTLFCDELWFRYTYGDEEYREFANPIKEFGGVVYAGITEYMITNTCMNGIENPPTMNAYNPDIINIYGEPSLLMRNGVGEGTMSKEHSDIKAMNIIPLTINCVYPNPLYDNDLTIDIISSRNLNNVKVIIYDISGRLVKSDTLNFISGINKVNIDTTILTSGVYIIEISSGENTISSKFVKVR